MNKEFNHRNKIRQKRKENTRKQKSSKRLMVCEGTQTEPNYFKEFQTIINKDLPIDAKLRIDIKGKGRGTTSLVNIADKIQNDIDEYSKDVIRYSKIFVVFDKDDFPDKQFDNAVSLCNKKGYIPLWSNEAIEYWFLLHFNRIEAAMNRKDYINKLQSAFKKKQANYQYKKNSNEIYSKLCEYGSLRNARHSAKIIHEKHLAEAPSKTASCTTVYKFFDEVEEKIKELE